MAIGSVGGPGRSAAAGAGRTAGPAASRATQRSGGTLIYLDTSVALAHLLAEDHTPPESLWDETLVSSRLLEYEMWSRLNARDLATSHGEHARELLQRVALLELASPVLARALEPFPTPVRTLEALHLASIEFLRSQRQDVTLATYDVRLAAIASKLRIPMFALG
ncbi:MAG: PIN domain-containing protein [Gemmatimonadaceae bacterium]